MADATKAPAPEDCLQKKAIYDHCFDLWYKDVFLKNKSNGKLGCQELYKEYSACMTEELKADLPLVQSIRAEMNPTHAAQWIGKDLPDPSAKSEKQ
ncbi:hypothetical protein ACHHYP_02458 [Achlya hypogyna]|uniref:Mitochondrial distribution and morphology protein 35 n=1 Tax=Achlya hypogyna TaxID=1202772 RepID=A0A1V9Z6C8_ACHHY|nr:hypothetical protein ACHHYP_02458 [Achlya hypogyna]